MNIREILTIIRLVGILLMLTSLVLVKFGDRVQQYWNTGDSKAQILVVLAVVGWVVVLVGLAVFICKRLKRPPNSADYVAQLARIGRPANEDAESSRSGS